MAEPHDDDSVRPIEGTQVEASPSQSPAVPSYILGEVTQPPIQTQSQIPYRATPQMSDLTQAQLGHALRRYGKSSNGKKATLVKRLEELGVKSYADALKAAEKFNSHGCLHTLPSPRKRSPKWSADEAARLCHVMADPRNSTAIARLYNGTPSRAEIDSTIPDPWENELVEMFNSDDFEPSTPVAKDGISQDRLDEFDPENHPYPRSSSYLKGRRCTFILQLYGWS